ncbi:MAG: leucine-rich repeat protein [Clostridia bacterium]|nr:leucine-rich repeat protein [Clostridia bacterium]
MKQITKKLAALLLSLCFFAALASEVSVPPRAAAAEFDFYYSINNNYARIDSVRKTFAGVFRFPDYVESGGKKCYVTSVADNAFADCKQITEVIMCKYVTRIGVGAFSGCTKLAKITLSANLKTIGRDAFVNTALTSVTIPANVSSIDGNVFYNCKKLTAINVAAENGNYASEYGILFNKDMSKLLIFPIGKPNDTITVRDTVKTVCAYAFACAANLKTINLSSALLKLEDGAFYKCAALQKINKMPKTLAAIGAYAFCGCKKLTSFHIPAAVKNLDVSAFYDSGIAAFTVDAASTSFSAENGVIFNKDKSVIVFYPGAKADASYTIPASVRSFYTFTFLKADRLKEIRAAADNEHFYDLEGVLYQKGSDRLLLYPHAAARTQYRVYEGTKEIFTNAFAYAGNLETVILPASLAAFGESAFYGCKKLKSVGVPEGVTALSPYLFADCPALATVSLPQSLQSFEATAFSGDTLKTVYYTGTAAAYKALVGSAIPSSVKVIPSHVHNMSVREVKKATCGATGVSTQTCACSLAVSVITPKTGNHTFGQWTVVKEPSFTAGGVNERRCSVCQKVEQVSVPRLTALPDGEAFFVKDDENKLIYVYPNVTVNMLTAGIAGLSTVSGRDLVPCGGDALLATGMVAFIPIDPDADPDTVQLADPYLIVVQGDLDGDGVIGAADARLALRNSVELDALDDAQTAAAKVGGADIVSATEARLILRASVELEDPAEWLAALNKAA